MWLWNSNIGCYSRTSNGCFLPSFFSFLHFLRNLMPFWSKDPNAFNYNQSNNTLPLTFIIGSKICKIYFFLTIKYILIVVYNVRVKDKFISSYKYLPNLLWSRVHHAGLCHFEITSIKWAPNYNNILEARPESRPLPLFSGLKGYFIPFK